MQFQIAMSKSAYAKRRGVTPKAVRKAIASGRIAEAVYPDGSIDADLADRLWEQNADTTQRRGGAGRTGEGVHDLRGLRRGFDRRT